MHWRTQGVPFPATRDPQGSLGTRVTCDTCLVVTGVGHEWLGMAPRVSEGSENQSVQSVAGRSGRIRREQSGGFRESVSMCVNTMSVRPIRRSSSGLPPTTPFSSTKEPLGYQGAPSAPSLSTSNEWQFITSGTVCPPHEPVVIWVQLSNSRAKAKSIPGVREINVSARSESQTWPNQLPKCLKSLVP